MKSKITILFAVFISIATLSFAQDAVNVPSMDKIISIDIFSFRSGWSLRINKDGSGLVNFGSSGGDGGIAPANSLSIQDVYHLLVPHLLNKEPSSTDVTNVTLIGNNNSVVTYYIVNNELIQRLYEASIKSMISPDMNSLHFLILKHPFVIEDAASKK
jgi:hypothetical protein